MLAKAVAAFAQKYVTSEPIDMHILWLPLKNAVAIHKEIGPSTQSQKDATLSY